MKQITVPYITCLSHEKSVESLNKKLRMFGSLGHIDSINWPEVTDYRPDSSFYIAHDGQRIYILFENKGLGLKAVNSMDQSPVSQDSCVEFFVSPMPENGRYWNFEFNAIGAINASHRIVRPEPTRLSEQELEAILRWPSVGNTPFEEIDGEQHWNLTVAIPLKLLNVELEGKEIHMKANFLKCGSKTRHPHYLSWSPINTEAPDFHRKEFFGDLILEPY